MLGALALTGLAGSALTAPAAASTATAPAAAAVAASSTSPALATDGAPTLPTPGETDPREPGIVVVGVGGLQWTDVDRAVTPTLWRMLSQGAVASVSVRTAQPETCRVDGWLTLSATRRLLPAEDAEPGPDQSPGTDPAGAATDPASGPDGAGDGADGTADCLPMPEVSVQPGAVGPVDVPGWVSLVGVPAQESGTPGTLAARFAEAGVCTTAVGAGAALALADGTGHVARYAATTGDLGPADLAACPVTFVDGGEPPASPEARQVELRALDDLLAELSDAVPDGTRVVVAGVHDSPVDDLGLQVVIDWRKGRTASGWLQSASTRRPGLVTLTDLSATVLHAAGLETADLEGAPMTVAGDRRMSPERTVENRRYLVELTTTVPHLMPVFVAVVGLLGGLGLVALLAPRLRRSASSPMPGATAWRIGRSALLLAACAPAGAYLSTLARWWGGHAPAVAASAWTVGCALACALVVWVLSRLLRPGPWRLAAVVAGLTWLVLTADGVTGTTLQHGSLLGVTASLGARYYGFGNLTFAVYLVSALTVAGALAAALVRRDRRWWAASAVAGVGLITVVVDGWPGFGADFGGIFAVVPAFAVLLLTVARVPPTPWRVLVTIAVTVATVAAISVVDWLRPGASSHLGTFVQRLVDGEAWPVVAAKASAAWQTVANPLGLVAALACLVLAVPAVGPSRWRPAPLRAAYERVPMLRSTVVAVVVGAVAGTALNDSGIAVGGTVLALAVALLAVGWADARPLVHAATTPPGDVPAGDVPAGVVPAGDVPAATTPVDAPAADARPGVVARVTGFLREPATLTALAGGLLAAMLLGSVVAPGIPPAAGDVAVPRERIAHEGDTVVLVGTSGVRWEDVNRSTTPTLWRLLRDGASAGATSVGVTGASRRCESAGWLALSAGRAPVTGVSRDGWRCIPWGVQVDPDGDGARIAGWDELTTAQRTSDYRPRLGVLAGALADHGTCASAVGQGAALALADRDGRVARYRTVDQALFDGTFGECPLTVVDAGAAPLVPRRVLTPGGALQDAMSPELLEAERDAALQRIDTTVRRVMAAAPADAVVLVVDVGDPTARRPGLGLGLGPAAGGPARFLTVSSTRWEGVIRLLDVPTTLLVASGAPEPAEFTGAPLAAGGARPADTGTTVDQIAELSVRDLALRSVSGSITTTPMLLALAAFLLTVLLAWRRVRPGVARVVGQVLDALFLVLASMPAGLFLMTTWYWWRGPTPLRDMWLGLAAATLTVAGLGALAPRRPAWAAPGVIAAITFGVLTLDALLGTPLHRGSPLGPAPALGGRYYGFGNPTYSVYVVAAIVAVAALATWLLQRGRRWLAIVVAVALSGVALVVDLWPTLGADVGGGLVLLPVLGVLVLAVAGVRVSWQRLVLIGVAGLVLVAGIGFLDWSRPPGDRSHLGRFVQSTIDGTAWETVSRKAGFALSSLTSGSTAWLTVALVVAVAVLLWSRGPVRGRWLERLEAQWPIARPMLVALLLAAVGGALVNDYGVRIATIMLFAAVPLVGLLAVRTLPGTGGALAFDSARAGGEEQDDG